MFHIAMLFKLRHDLSPGTNAPINMLPSLHDRRTMQCTMHRRRMSPEEVTQAVEGLLSSPLAALPAAHHIVPAEAARRACPALLQQQALCKEYRDFCMSISTAPLKKYIHH